MEVCDECDKYMHLQEDIKFFFDEEHQESTSCRKCLCLDCFEQMFGVIRYAKLVAPNPHFERKCCCCHHQINQKKETSYTVRASSHDINIEAIYCSGCYQKDIGS
jgi:hypothetical protein